MGICTKAIFTQQLQSPTIIRNRHYTAQINLKLLMFVQTIMYIYDAFYVHVTVLHRNKFIYNITN